MQHFKQILFTFREKIVDFHDSCDYNKYRFTKRETKIKENLCLKLRTLSEE